MTGQVNSVKGSPVSGYPTSWLNTNPNIVEKKMSRFGLRKKNFMILSWGLSVYFPGGKKPDR